jgi:hypothetical protein
VTRDIADSVDWVNDLTVDMWNLSSPPVVGSTYIKRVVEFNRGTQALSSTNQYDYETQAPYSFATVAPSTYQPGISRATWDNPLALPLVSRQYDVTHSVPVSVPINTLLVYTDTIFPVTGDTTWWDNNLLKIDNTVGSYDPNYKEVSPEGTGPQGYISLSDSVLEYVIHFQNIGNYYATNIRITDQIDSDLEISTMRVVYSTHLQQTHINASGEIEFYFPNINLPALSMDSIESNGFVVYTIHLKPGLAPGTEIENSADIYFDFNPPITTNTTLNTIFTTGVDEHPALTAVSVFPNPNDGSFSVYFPNEISGEIVIRLFNITGQTIMERRESVAGRSLLKIEESNLTSGVYFLQVEINGVQKNVKLVVQ